MCIYLMKIITSYKIMALFDPEETIIDFFSPVGKPMKKTDYRCCLEIMTSKEGVLCIVFKCLTTSELRNLIYNLHYWVQLSGSLEIWGSRNFSSLTTLIALVSQLFNSVMKISDKSTLEKGIFILVDGFRPFKKWSAGSISLGSR